MTFGEQLRVRREAACMTQEELAIKLELARSLPGTYETDVCLPSRQTFERMLELFPDLPPPIFNIDKPQHQLKGLGATSAHAGAWLGKRTGQPCSPGMRHHFSHSKSKMLRVCDNCRLVERRQVEVQS